MLFNRLVLCCRSGPCAKAAPLASSPAHGLQCHTRYPGVEPVPPPTSLQTTLACLLSTALEQHLNRFRLLLLRSISLSLSVPACLVAPPVQIVPHSSLHPRDIILILTPSRNLSPMNPHPRRPRRSRQRRLSGVAAWAVREGSTLSRDPPRARAHRSQTQARKRVSSSSGLMYGPRAATMTCCRLCPSTSRLRH